MKQKVKCIMCKKNIEIECSKYTVIGVCNRCGLKDICEDIVKEYEKVLNAVAYIRDELPLNDLAIAINNLEMFVEGL